MKATILMTAACTLAVIAGTSNADNLITYVDHVWEGNGIAPINTQGPSNDGFWDIRAFANNGTIFQNAGTSAIDDAHRLQTIVSGVLDPNLEYNIYVYFWSDGNVWPIRASLVNTAEDYPLYMFGDPGIVTYGTPDNTTHFSDELSPNPFTTAVMINEGNRTLAQAHLGTVTGVTGFTVYIDDYGQQTVQQERTWYDGVGYQVVPEPGSLALCAIGVGVLGLIRRRR